MARSKLTSRDTAGMMLLLILSLPILIAGWIGETIGWLWFTVIVGLLICGVIVYQNISRRERQKYLLDKYGDQEIVNKIMNRYMWEGQTAGQLLDSLGQPAAVDNLLLKSRSRQVWKYRPIGRRRYALRVTLDDDCVIGWKQRN